MAAQTSVVLGEVGYRNARSILYHLSQIHISPESLSRVLDFGCGCGRSLISISRLLPNADLYGCDIDEEAIGFCKSELKFGNFYSNSETPPLSYIDDFYDLIYGISVFTHLDEDRQFAWLKELGRILKPGGVLLLTLHGSNIWKSLPYRYRNIVNERGFLYTTFSTKTLGILPDWYQNAFHSEEYVKKEYDKILRVVNYVPKGMNNEHDVVILQKQ